MTTIGRVRSISCEFCSAIGDRPTIAENEFAVAFYDEYPVSPGHALVVPRRHVTSVFELPNEELAALWELVALTRARLDQDRHPDAFNIGVNDGQAAGQTVGHAHVHLIPRYVGDVTDPRGGCRWVVPQCAEYWDKNVRVDLTA